MGSWRAFSSFWDDVSELATHPCLLSLMPWNWKVRFPPFFLHIFPLYKKRSLQNGINTWCVNIHTHPHEKRCHQELKVLRNSVLLGIAPEARCLWAAGFHMFLSIIHPAIDPTLGTPRLFRQWFFQAGIYLLSEHLELLSPCQRGVLWCCRASRAALLSIPQTSKSMHRSSMNISPKQNLFSSSDNPPLLSVRRSTEHNPSCTLHLPCPLCPLTTLTAAPGWTICLEI